MNSAHFPIHLLLDVRPRDPCPDLNDRRPEGGAPFGALSPPSGRPQGRRRESPTLTLRYEHHDPFTRNHRSQVQAQELLPGRLAQRRRKGPIHLTVRQEEYCRQAVHIHRFCYNLAVRTHRFCRNNRLPWPSWMDISKAFNAYKREDHPFVTQVAAVVATGAFRDFGQVLDNKRRLA